MRKVDKLGRIVIPMELRKKYGLHEDSSVDFIDTGDGITVKASDSICKICRREISPTSDLPLCKSCIAAAAKIYNQRF